MGRVKPNQPATVPGDGTRRQETARGAAASDAAEPVRDERLTDGIMTDGAGPAARTSELLQRSVELHDADRISVAELLDALGDRAFGLLIVLLVLPNLIPGPTIPGYSLIFATGIALVASQMVRGFVRPRLPRWCLRRSFDRARLRALLARAMPYLRRLERYAHARPSRWTTPGAERWIAALAIAVAIALAIPVPLGNTPPALALLVLGMGLIERDSRLLVAGVIGGIAAVIYVGVLSAVAVEAADWIFGTGAPLLPIP